MLRSVLLPETKRVDRKLEHDLGYLFQRPALLEQALTHKSFAREGGEEDRQDNERLEFLGDAVLALIVSEYLLSALPASNEGELSKIKALVVSRVSLAQVSRRLHLGTWLRLGHGEEMTKGRDKDSILGNALEALLASIYLDGGLDAVRSSILRIFRPELEAIGSRQAHPFFGDYKSRFQEWTHKQYEAVPLYRMVGESGPDHQKAFEVEVVVNGHVLGTGRGKTKKLAEQMAARQALEELM